MLMLLLAKGEERRQVQRATRARPARQTSAQRREARMTTMLGSMDMEIMAAGGADQDEVEEAAAGVGAAVAYVVLELAGVGMPD